MADDNTTEILLDDEDDDYNDAGYKFPTPSLPQKTTTPDRQPASVAVQINKKIQGYSRFNFASFQSSSSSPSKSGAPSRAAQRQTQQNHQLSQSKNTTTATVSPFSHRPPPIKRPIMSPPQDVTGLSLSTRPLHASSVPAFAPPSQFTSQYSDASYVPNVSIRAQSPAVRSKTLLPFQRMKAVAKKSTGGGMC